MAKIPVPSGPAGEIIGGSRLENGIMLNSSAKAKDSFVAMMQFIDWLCYSDAGQEFAKWGVEGTTFTKEGGKRVLAKDVNFRASTRPAPRTCRWTTASPTASSPTAAPPSCSTPVHRGGAGVPEGDEAQEARPWPPPAVQRRGARAGHAGATPLKDHVNQNTLKFILGQRPLSEWDAYVKELDAKGQSKYVELANKAYKAYSDKK